MHISHSFGRMYSFVLYEITFKSQISLDYGVVM